MKHKLLTALVLIVLGIVAFAPSQAMGAKAATGAYYALPAWDQTLPASDRFTVLTNMSSAAVLDRETGLVWEQSPSTDVLAWDSAQTHCNQLTKGGRLGWRMPTVQELASLVDPTQSSPSLPSGHPFSNVQSSVYWSATTLAILTSYAWHVSFFNAYVSYFDKDYSLYVWCVRGGHGVDPQ